MPPKNFDCLRYCLDVRDLINSSSCSEKSCSIEELEQKFIIMLDLKEKKKMGEKFMDLGTAAYYAVNSFGERCAVNKNIMTLGDDKNMQEKLNEYLEKNNIEVDENGNFEMYLVVDADDTEHEIGSIHYGKVKGVYNEKSAYEDLKGNNYKNNGGYFTFTQTISGTFKNDINVKKHNTIKEDLLVMEDKMFSILVNKENVVGVYDDIIYINKYKVIEPINLFPQLKFKITNITDDEVTVLLYNNLTEKSKEIHLEYDFCDTPDVEYVKDLINEHLAIDEENVGFINSTVDDGVLL